MIDEVDTQILDLLQTNARITNAEIARTVGMAPSGILERIRRLEEKGLITCFTARLNPSKLGLSLLAYVLVRTDDCGWHQDTGTSLAESPGVQEVHHIAGEDCFLIKVRVRDTEALGKFLQDHIGRIKTVRSTRTTIVLETVKETCELPLDLRASEVSRNE